MTDHLPECQPWNRTATPDGCHTCDALRACEQRVREEEYSLPEGHPSRDLSYWEAGFSAGVQAAREAVAVYYPDTITSELGQGYEYALRQALAAIDALRGES